MGGFGGSGGAAGGSSWVTKLSLSSRTCMPSTAILFIKVRAGKKFLPVAVRFGKRYYQRRKYQKGMYAGIGGVAGYHYGSRMNQQDRYYQNGKYPFPCSAHEGKRHL